MVDESKPDQKSRPNVTERAEAAQRARAARLAGALRTNLRRRNPTDYKISERPGVRNADNKDQESDG